MRLVIAITGASGSVYARRALEVCAGRSDLDVHWVASSTAAQVWAQEFGEAMPERIDGATRWGPTDFSAPFASGSNAADAVVVCPCSMSTLGRVAHGTGQGLIDRACDVALKERKRLVLVARETPLSLVHLRNMVAATEAGAVIVPAIPSFYGAVQTLQDAIDTVVARALDRAGIENLNLIRRWGTQP